MAGEWWFYHLERTSLERALGPLLDKCLERNWRVLVLSPSEERLADLDAALWTWSDESFTPHGRAGTGNPDRQPVLLSPEADPVNRAHVCVLLDGFDAALPTDLARTMVVFDDRDTHARSVARQQYKTARDQGQPVRYFRQGAKGGWQEQK